MLDADLGAVGLTHWSWFLLWVPCLDGAMSPPCSVPASQLTQPAEMVTVVAFHNVPPGKWPENECARLAQAVEWPLGDECWQQPGHGPVRRGERPHHL